ncbi:hypothetical protein OG689_33555 [Kitasatospora sp. NBC_00240]|uniref:DUF6629 family protein n=1 Tax=Kitasatospora sp. NBC_00240 TaxID=2903567 RepID=UPI002256C217|nr:DUF6629 family protein [Kitasatospora sp. NBC_00240]MCX5214131.1 hypothetical protein [Kitasatospora sp. NBC_00240]
MCWSAEADLVAGVVVSGLGLACLARVRRAGQLPLAALPLVLGVHQLIESAVWLGVDGRIGPGPAQWARTAWAVIALPLLPALVSVGVLRAVPGARGRGRRTALAVLGVLVAAALAVAVATHPVAARADGHTLSYGVGVPYAPVLIAGYLTATVGSLVLSGDRVLRLLGLLTGAAALAAALLWRLAFASAWCALAALVSAVLLWWVRQDGRPGAARFTARRVPGRVGRSGPR